MKLRDLARAMRARIPAFPTFPRFLALQCCGLVLSLTGIAQYSVPVALILGGLVLTVAGELHGDAKVAHRAY